MSFFAELKRRNVFKVGFAYAVTAWILLQLTDVVADILLMPEWAPQLILLFLMVGFVPALIFAWAFEMTPEGLKKEKDVDRSESITPNTGKKLNYAIMGMLGLGMAYFFWESRIDTQATAPEQLASENVATDTGPAVSSTEGSIENNAKSIAVLPFTNRSPNADDAYFTDGIHDDLLTQLAKIEAFSVISRTSVMEYRDTSKNLKQIGTELGVANIMEGAVQRAGSRVRINVQLIDAASDEHLWAEVYDRELTTENLFDIQSEIAVAIAGALQATLTDSEIANVSDVPTSDVAAYELYLQGNRFSLGETEIGFDTAVALFEEALNLDPNFKLAWIGLAKAHINNYWSYGGNPTDREKTRAAIDRAKAIDPDFPELYMAEGFYHYWGLLDYETALLNLEKAIALMPSNADAHMWKGWASRRAGHWEQAIESMQMAIRLNPRVVINLIETSQTLGYVGRWDEALVLTEKAYELDPDSFWAKWYLAENLVLVNGDIERAATLMVGAQHSNDVSFTYPYWSTQMLAHRFDMALQIAQTWSADWEISMQTINLREQLLAESLRALGRNTDAKEKANEALLRLATMKQTGRDDYRVSTAQMRAYSILGDTQNVSELVAKVMSTKPVDAVEDLKFKYQVAKSYARADMPDESIEMLELLLSGYSNITVPWLELDPAFNGIRNEPEFVALLERHR